MPTSARTLTFAAAINEGLREEMRRDPAVVLLGEDVGAAGGVFGLTRELLGEFGLERVFDTPISETALAGLALGAAMTGLRPVLDVMFGDFLTLAMDPLVNQAAKTHYMSGGKLRAPLVVLAAAGGGRRLAAQHSQSLYAWMAHIPGLKVAVPSNPADAKGLVKASIRDNNPVIFFHDKTLLGAAGEVSADSAPVPLGRAAIPREGRDATVIAVGGTVRLALEAAERLAQEGVSVEVADPRTLAPLDAGALVRSAEKTGRCLVAEPGYPHYGAAAELAALVSERAFRKLKAPVARLTAADSPVPFSPELEDHTLPRCGQIVEQVRSLLRS